MSIMKITEAMHIDRDIESQLHFVSSIVYASPVHYHDYFEFFLITEGKCIHKVNNSEQHLAEGALVFIRPEDVHCYDYEGSMDCSFLNIAIASAVVHESFGFLGDTFCSKKLLALPLPPYAILSPLEKDNLTSRYEKLETLSTIDKQQSKIQTRSMVIEILTQYFSNTRDSSNSFSALWLEMLLTKMQKKENFTGGLQRMYELSGRSVGHLNRVFRQHFNVTPTEYINRIRLSYVKNLIINTNLTITNISLEAGFENLSHFNHLFKKYFGMAPTALRSMAKNIE